MSTLRDWAAFFIDVGQGAAYSSMLARCNYPGGKTPSRSTYHYGDSCSPGDPGRKLHKPTSHHLLTSRSVTARYTCDESQDGRLSSGSKVVYCKNRCSPKTAMAVKAGIRLLREGRIENGTKGYLGVSKGLPMREGGFTERQSSSEVDYGKKSRTATSAKAQRKIASMSFSKDQKKVELA